MQDGTAAALSVVLTLALVGVAALIGAWDIYALASLGEGYTVSSVVARWASEYPILAFGLGVIVGHVFWPHCQQHR